MPESREKPLFKALVQLDEPQMLKLVAEALTAGVASLEILDEMCLALTRSAIALPQVSLILPR